MVSLIPNQALKSQRASHLITSRTFLEKRLSLTTLGTSISQHHYSGSCEAGTLPGLMDKPSIRSNLTQFTSGISAVHAKGLTYVLGETNSYYCHGAAGVSDTAGAALWALDYTLFSATLGIDRVYFHEGIGYKYNFVCCLSLLCG